MIVQFLAPAFAPALAAAPAAPVPAAVSAPAPTDPATEATAVPVAPTGPDRSRPPDVKDSPVLPLPEPEIHELGPGVRAWFVHVPGVRKVSVNVVLDRGMVELAGKADAVSRGAGWLADAAAGAYDAAAFSELQDLKEISVSTYLGQHEGGVSMTVPLDELATGLELQGLALRSPTFPKAEVKRWVLDQELYYTVEGPASQAALGKAGIAYGWFAADHPYGVRPDLAQFKQVTPKALLARWDALVHESPITVVAVGDLEWSALEAPLRAMTEGLGKPGAPPSELAVDGLAKTRIVAIDMPGQEQVAVRARWKGPTNVDPDHPELIVANFFLGGAFLSRLNSNLREEKGFTYGARSTYGSGPTYGTFNVSVDVGAENLGATLTEIEKEIHRIATEPGTEEELVSAHRAFAADWNRTLQTADSAAGVYLTALERQMTIADYRALTESLAAVGLPDVQAACARWLGDEAPVLWVLVGDRAAITEQLSAIHKEAEFVSAHDAMFGMF